MLGRLQPIQPSAVSGDTIPPSDQRLQHINPPVCVFVCLLSQAMGRGVFAMHAVCDHGLELTIIFA